MSGLKVYVDLVSQPSRAIVAFLNANKIKFETKLVQIQKGENKSEEFKRISPFGLVPAIDDNGFKLTESVAILRYLCREKKVPDHWYPKDIKLQAKVDEYLEWQHLNTRYQLMVYVQLKYLIPFLKRGNPTAEQIAEQEKLMNITLDKLENHWLKDTPYLVGDKISIADVLGACEVEQPKIAGYDPCASRPILANWLQRVKQDMHPHFEEAHKIIRIITKKYGGKPPI